MVMQLCIGVCILSYARFLCSQQTGNAPRLVEAGLSGGLKQLMQGESRVKKVSGGRVF